MNILIVENDIAFVSVLTESIQVWGHNPEKSNTGKDALRKVRQKRFDLVLLDVFLPDIRGSELIPHLKEIWHATNIVAMTEYNSRELELEVRQKGIIYYMEKPVDTEILKSILDHISKKKGGGEPWKN